MRHGPQAILSQPGALTCHRMEINGLPLHPLVVHAAVVFGPLAALVGLASTRACRGGAGCCAGRWSCSPWSPPSSIVAAYLTGEALPRRASPSCAPLGARPTRSGPSCCAGDDRASPWCRARRPGRWAAPPRLSAAGSVLADAPRVRSLVPAGVVAIALAASVFLDRRRRRPGRLGLTLSRARHQSVASRAASSRRNDSTRPGRPSPAATASSRPHSGSSAAVGAAARAVLGHLVEVGERLDQVLGLHVREPERPDARGVDDPARSPSGQRAACSADVEVCRPRPVTALTMPTSRSASGTSALTSVDLPTPLCPTSTLVRSREPLAQLGQVAAALGHHPRHAERPVGRQQRLGVGEVGLGQAQQRLHARRRTPPPGRGRSAAAAARGRPAR